MSATFSEQDIAILDRVIETRRSVRACKADALSDSIIKAVVHAGVYAPYAALAVGDAPEFRRFFVFRKGSSNLSLINEIIKKGAAASLKEMEKEAQANPLFKQKSAKYSQMLGRVSQNGMPGISELPCLIVAAELRGIPSVEKQSLAHVMQNMWLKATALGLGFQLMSVIESLTEIPDFSKLLKLNFGEFAFNGCIIGYPAQPPGPRKTLSEDRAITWL